MTYIYCDRFSCANCEKQPAVNNGKCTKDDIQITYDDEVNRSCCYDYRPRSF